MADSYLNENVKKYIQELSKLANDSCAIDPSLYQKYEVKRGLRDISGRGVLAGLTEIAEVRAYIIDDNEMVPCEGRLFYRGYDVEDITTGFINDDRFGFEETVYLLLFGKLPKEDELKNFEDLLSSCRVMKNRTMRDYIINNPSKSVMNSLARSVLMMYSQDADPDSTSAYNVLRQAIELISRFPLMAVYGYQAYAHYHKKESLYIHRPLEGMSTAQTILHLLRPDSVYTDFEAKILDLALVLHAEHGGGNNSTFTTHVVTSSGTDTYSAIAAALGSLKGPRHGGANIKVVEMMEDAKEVISDWKDDEEIEKYLERLLNKEAFDNSGLIYGIGHAVYSLSDPRAKIFKRYVYELAKEKGLEEEFGLYSKVEELAPKVIGRIRKMYKGVSANVDFYSGFVYRMLNLPPELYTPMFAVARIAGWCAHRIEEIANNGKIIRPAYKSISKRTDYIDLKNR